jgi:chromosome segregation protein
LGDFQLADSLLAEAARGGAVLTRDGRYAGQALVAGGRPVQAGADAAGLLARLKEVEALAGQKEKAAAGLAGQQAAAEAAAAALARNRATADLNQAEKDLSLAEQEAGQAEKRRRALAGEVAETERAAEALTAKLAAGRISRAEAEARAEAARERADGLKTKLREAAEALDETRNASDEASARAAASAEKLDRARHDLDLAARWLAEAEEGLAAREAEAEGLAGEIAALTERSRDLADQVAAFPERLRLSEAALEETRRDLAGEREKYQARENTTRELRRRREELHGVLNGQETEVLALDFDLERLAENLRRDWRVVMPEPGPEPPPAASPVEEPAAASGEKAGTELPAAPTELDPLDYAGRDLPPEAESRRGTLKAKIEALGEVSLGALEKEAELKAEYARYQTQYDDLTRAIADLKAGISRINHTCRILFEETFKAVDEKFREIFPILFEGGQGWLSLTDERAPLESGVEIHVHPPGKKLLVMSLLSGGEKALTALALIFALYLIKPSPFCLLDETDAPLDEANIDRFNRLLQRLSRASQIIMVTHNKRTMTICGTLYGVTMEAPGVSRLVSVNLAEAEAIADA